VDMERAPDVPDVACPVDTDTAPETPAVPEFAL